jgi:hypothetical protein
MGIGWLGPEFQGFCPQESYKLREVDTGGATLETAATGEAGPKIAVSE